jgi:hypothetical protein
MKPLNKKERNKAFFRVIVFFSLAFVIAILLAFTTMSASQLSNAKSHRELEKIRTSLEFQRVVLTPAVKEVNTMLAEIPEYEKQNENIDVLNSDIGNLLSDTKDKIQDVDSQDTVLYKEIITSLSDLQIAYNKQLDLGESASGLSELRSELQMCRAEYEQLKKESRNSTDCSGYIQQVKQAEKKLEELNLENRALQSEIERLRNQ